MKEWKSKSIVIVGAARQGLALARFLLLRGARVTLNDHKPAEALAAAQDDLSDLVESGLPLTWVCGGHPLNLLDGTDLICVSGGVPLDLPLLTAAQKRCIPLTNDSQIFMQLVPCKVIGITGSAGKTTTTTLVGRIANAAIAHCDTSFRVWVGGNIGSPLISAIDEMASTDLAIVEFSSFQLELMDCSPDIAVVLNITPNHLDRHGTMEAYAAAKARILQFQDEQGLVVLGRDDPGAWALKRLVHGQIHSFGLSRLPEGQMGAFLDQGKIFLRLQSDQEAVPILSCEQIALRGEHNLRNVMAACAVAGASGFPLEAIPEGVQGFGGVPHRLEFVRRWGGADWYNDSIATAPERAMASIRSFNEPLVLLTGGRDKDLPWEEFADLVRHRVDHLVVFGEAAAKILRAFGANNSKQPTITCCSGLHEAVQAAAQIVQPGDVVLLAPGGTSFDEFKDFEERGHYFAQWVKDLP